MNFTDYFSLDNFKAITAYSNQGRENIDNEWRKGYEKVNEENFHKPLFKFLTNLRDSNKLGKIENGEGHSTRMLNEWNKFLENLPESQEDKITDNFYKVVSYSLPHLKKDAIEIPQEEYLEKYNKLTASITKGNFSHYEMAEDSCQCYECSQRFRLEIKNWSLSFKSFGKKADGEVDYENLVNPESCLADNVVELKVDFPSGEVLVADWFNITEFTQTVEYNGKDKWDDEKSLNSAKGRIFTTSHYANEHSFISVSVGNSSPEVIKNKDSLVIGRVDYEKEKTSYISTSGKFKKAAKVCTDFWGVTMIDKETLVDIIAQKLGKEKAAETVESYIKENSYNLDILKLNPGEYDLKFHGSYWKFNDKIKDESLPKDFEKFFTVSKHELKLENKKNVKLKF